MTVTSKLNVKFELDNGATAYRIGPIVLDTDETSEHDFSSMQPEDGKFAFYTSRVKTVNPVTIDNLRTHGPQLSKAAALLLPDVQLDVIAYNCTSGTIAMGYEEVERQINKGRKNVPVVTPITAAIAAFNILAIKSISLLTPCIENVLLQQIRKRL